LALIAIFASVSIQYFHRLSSYKYTRGLSPFLLPNFLRLAVCVCWRSAWFTVEEAFLTRKYSTFRETTLHVLENPYIACRDFSARSWNDRGYSELGTDPSLRSSPDGKGHYQ